MTALLIYLTLLAATLLLIWPACVLSARGSRAAEATHTTEETC